MSRHRPVLVRTGAVFAFVYVFVAAFGGRPSAPLTVGLYVAVVALLLTGSGAPTNPVYGWPPLQDYAHGRRGADHATERLATRLAGVGQLDAGGRAYLAEEIQRTLAAAIASRAATGVAIPPDLAAFATDGDAATAQVTDPAALASLLTRIEAL